MESFLVVGKNYLITQFMIWDQYGMSHGDEAAESIVKNQSVSGAGRYE
jgi:hypothetical protein